MPRLVLGQEDEEEEEEEEDADTPTPTGHSRLAPWWVGSGLLLSAVLLSAVTVWVLRQVSGGWHSPTPPSQCHQVPESHRFDCYPERRVVVTRELCEGRGCCFIETSPAVGGTRGVPWCFYPPDFPSYALQSLNQTALGMAGLLVRREKAYYPRDIGVLRLDVELETDTRLHVKVSVPLVPCDRAAVPLHPPCHVCRWLSPAQSGTSSCFALCVASVSISNPLPSCQADLESIFSPHADNRCGQPPVRGSSGCSPGKEESRKPHLQPGLLQGPLRAAAAAPRHGDGAVRATSCMLGMGKALPAPSRFLRAPLGVFLREKLLVASPADGYSSPSALPQAVVLTQGHSLATWGGNVAMQGWVASAPLPEAARCPKSSPGSCSSPKSCLK